MDDLIQFLITLMQSDLTLLEIFQGYGQPIVNIIGLQLRVTAAYPRISIYGTEGKQMAFGDENAALTFGKVHIEVITKQSATCVDAELARQTISARLKELFLGYIPAGQLPVSGQQVSNQYKCAYMRQLQGTGEIPNPNDPKVLRWRGMYEVLMNQNSTYNLVPPGNWPESV